MNILCYGGFPRCCFFLKVEAGGTDVDQPDTTSLEAPYSSFYFPSCTVLRIYLPFSSSSSCTIIRTTNFFSLKFFMVPVQLYGGKDRKTQPLCDNYYFSFVTKYLTTLMEQSASALFSSKICSQNISYNNYSCLPMAQQRNLNFYSLTWLSQVARSPNDVK